MPLALTVLCLLLQNIAAYPRPDAPLAAPARIRQFGTILFMAPGSVTLAEMCRQLVVAFLLLLFRTKVLRRPPVALLSNHLQQSIKTLQYPIGPCRLAGNHLQAPVWGCPARRTRRLLSVCLGQHRYRTRSCNAQTERDFQRRTTHLVSFHAYDCMPKAIFLTGAPLGTRRSPSCEAPVCLVQRSRGVTRAFLTAAEVHLRP